MMPKFAAYLAVMALVTYFIRMLPLVLVKKKITNKYILSFLHYIPYAVLSVMTVPAIFYSASLIPAVVGFIVAVVLAFLEKSLIVVAACSCLSLFITELLIGML